MNNSERYHAKSDFVEDNDGPIKAILLEGGLRDNIGRAVVRTNAGEEIDKNAGERVRRFWKRLGMVVLFLAGSGITLKAASDADRDAFAHATKYDKPPVEDTTNDNQEIPGIEEDDEGNFTVDTEQLRPQE